MAYAWALHEIWNLPVRRADLVFLSLRTTVAVSEATERPEEMRRRIWSLVEDPVRSG